jgi:hypothetical protein
VAAAGGIAGSLTSRGERVLVTNQANGALLFRVGHGFLVNPLVLGTDGEGSLSGALGERGAYVLTGTTLRFFPHGQTTASSARPLLLADGSAAAVTLTKQFAYVSEKKGSLQAFRLGHDGTVERAWIAVDNYEVLRLQTDLIEPIGQIRLLREHSDIHYGAVEFRKQNVRLWLPQSADLYMDFRGHRYQRRHNFSNFQLFRVETGQTVGELKAKEKKWLANVRSLVFRFELAPETPALLAPAPEKQCPVGPAKSE